MDLNKEIIKAAIWGSIIGDCLGVPLEFRERKYLDENPVKDMQGYGTYSKPPGTWSDDSSMILATMDGMHPFSLKQIAQNFVDWRYKDKYTQGSAFDIGNTTSCATARLNIHLVQDDFSEDIEYGLSGNSNSGNGSLMRMMPVALYLYFTENDFEKRKNFTYKLSALTHANDICKMSCHIFVEYILLYLEKRKVMDASIARYKAFNELCELFKDINDVFKGILISSEDLSSKSRDVIISATRKPIGLPMG